jgi:hypothetical protein
MAFSAGIASFLMNEMAELSRANLLSGRIGYYSAVSFSGAHVEAQCKERQNCNVWAAISFLQHRV